jgi:hypothetical protein
VATIDGLGSESRLPGNLIAAESGGERFVAAAGGRDHHPCLFREFLPLVEPSVDDVF